MKYLSATYCEHANECPAASGPVHCKCPSNCACREHMCKPSEKSDTQTSPTEKDRARAQYAVENLGGARGRAQANLAVEFAAVRAEGRTAGIAECVVSLEHHREKWRTIYEQNETTTIVIGELGRVLMRIRSSAHLPERDAVQKELATYRDHHARAVKGLAEMMVERDATIARIKVVEAERDFLQTWRAANETTIKTVGELLDIYVKRAEAAEGRCERIAEDRAQEIRRAEAAEAENVGLRKVIAEQGALLQKGVDLVLTDKAEMVQLKAIRDVAAECQWNDLLWRDRLCKALKGKTQ